MFQVEPIIWLQSFESPALTWVMSTISLLGYSIVYGILIAVLSFGFDLRKGLSIFLILAIGGIFTDGLKRGLQFPRPSDVDIRVIEPGQQPSPRLVEMGGGENFWSLPSSEAMEAVEIQQDWSYGLPSGHVSAAAAFFLGLIFFFRKKSIFIFSVSWIILMALSRMYLGRHFLADVLGGLAVGGLAVLIASFLLRPLKIEEALKFNKRDFLRLAVFTVPLVFLIPFIDLLDPDNIGRLLGIIVALFFILKIGFSSDKGTIWKRLGRILILFIVSLATVQLINIIMDSIDLDETRMVTFLVTFIISSLPFIGAFAISRRLNLYPGS